MIQHRIRSHLAIVAGTLLLITLGCAGSDDPAATPAVVSDAPVLVGIEPTIRPTIDEPVSSTAHFLAPPARTAPLVVVEILTNASGFEVDPNVDLADGTAAELSLGPPPQAERQLRFFDSTGNALSVRSFDLDLDALPAIADQLELGGDQVQIDSPDWRVLTSIRLPAFTDGYSTQYDFGSDGSVFVDVYRQVGDSMVLFSYGPMVDDEINGRPALRYDGTTSDRGFVFELDDEFIVNVGDLTRPGLISDDDLRAIAESVRAIDPPG